MNGTERTPRIETLLKKMQAQPRYASIEQARIITRCYRENEGLPRILQRSLALKAALEQIQIAIEPEELIVGNRTAGVRWGVVFPESGDNWVNKEFETLPTRPQDRFNVREEDIEIFRREIYPYWQGKSLEDVLRLRNGREFDDLGMVVKINQKDHAQGHICPDCERWLKLGPAGLRAWAQEKLESAPDQNHDFYRAVVNVMDGAITFILRYAELARKM
ncbi:MAG: formate C-acetyltransferase/glycerol dehydratase family glycyl radical enzyme, partial [Clostridia bacterium]|nr:formate C-acetyltransferase/glycerol dehydratase family glycyl radical enzyme [Clostridia bacterium]